jgi:hypothetical protein
LVKLVEKKVSMFPAESAGTRSESMMTKAEDGAALRPKTSKEAPSLLWIFIRMG